MSTSTVIWFQKWPIDALTEVSTHFISKLEMKTTEHDKAKIMKSMAFYHDTVRNACLEYYEKFDF